jgi:hypothetical protein
MAMGMVRPREQSNQQLESTPKMKTKTSLAMLASLALLFAVETAFALTGAIFTTNSACTGVNVNIFALKDDVYLDGGPQGGGAGLPDGTYYVQVTEPNGTLLGSSVSPPAPVSSQPFIVVGGEGNCIQLSAVLSKASDGSPGYDDTSNAGGEYKVWVSMDPTFPENDSKTDNFKVRANAQPGNLCVTKFYDANADGIFNNGDVLIPNWKVFVADLCRFTPVCVTLDAGSYNVCEDTPVELDWIHTTPTCVNALVTLGETTNVEFGNLCLGGGGGLTLGFWSNRNGQRLETDADFTALNAMCLRNPNGTIRTFAGSLNQKKSALHDWLLAANANNMANMLSAQLAAMELNVRHGNVSGTALVYAGSCGNTGVGGAFITINDLMNAAVSDPTCGLCADGNTPAGDPCRATQECWKTALDNANNNLNFVQSEPCPFSFNPPNCP